MRTYYDVDGNKPSDRILQDDIPDLPEKSSDMSIPIEVKPECSYAPILRECADIADERGKKYGDVKENFELTSQICDVVFDIQLTPLQVTQVLRAVKLAREKHCHQPDNSLDDINYNAIGLDLRKRSADA